MASPCTKGNLPRAVSRAAAEGLSARVLARKRRRVTAREDVFRIRSLGLDWDIGAMVYTPSGKVIRGADGKHGGFFLLHGGNGDYKSVEPLARILAERFGYKVVSMTFPGRLYLPSAKRDWPDDTLNPDGTARMPIWKKGEVITPDQYTLVRDTSLRARYGTRTFARAKRGTLFFERMAAWPVAFDDAMVKACQRHLPAEEYSVYAHGHSTGGAFTAILSQRLENFAGQTEVETAPIGVINRQKHAWSGSMGKIKGFDKAGPAEQDDVLKDPFTDLYLRTWRDRARYSGPEALGREGPGALMRLPWLMEEILDGWTEEKLRPQFKAEFPVTHNVAVTLEAAARTAARRLKLNRAETKALVERYLDYGRYRQGPGAVPVPPILYVNSRLSRDNSEEAFRAVVLPMLAKLKPAPRTHLVMVDAASHIYMEADGPKLPLGMAPVAAKLFDDAIKGGYFVTK
ncbi:MAG: hypothetical protein ACI82H_001510 [Alphaproteobacteria bacterium]|jgi:hypothetical protein